MEAERRPTKPQPDGLPESQRDSLAEESARPLEERLPPATLASPSELKEQPGEGITWWRPGWADAWRYVGYRWIFLLPAIGLLVLLVLSLFFPIFFGVFWVVGLKLCVFAGAIAVSLAGYVIRRAVTARKEPFCIYCGYNLTGLPDDYRCPECGRPYTWRLIAEYRRDPQWFIERYRAQRHLPPRDAPFHAGAVHRRARDGTA